MTASIDEHEQVLIVAADHPALAGHFPGHPIVPGVVLLDEALIAIGTARGMAIERCRLASVKFLCPVVPPATLTIRHRANGSSIDFSVIDGTRTVASGRVEAAQSPLSASGADNR